MLVRAKGKKSCQSSKCRTFATWIVQNFVENLRESKFIKALHPSKKAY